MNAWWSENASIWFGVIGGGGGGAFCGLLGSLIGILVPRGIGRPIIVPLTVLLAAAGVCTLALGIAAVTLGQPYHVYFPLLLTGGVVSLVMGAAVWLVIHGYRRAEARRMHAADLRRG
jgi:uncharacterized membrane protein YqgA involved in biofilm formation